MPNFAKIGQSVAVMSHFCDFSRWWPPPSWFWKKNWNFNGLSPVQGQFASPCQISSKSIKRLLRYGDLTGFFSKWRLSAILDLSGAYWDDPRRLLGNLYRCAKFGWNRCSTFDNMKVLIFCAFGLKIGVFWGFDSLSREQYSCDHEKALMVVKSRRLSQ